MQLVSAAFDFNK